MTVNPMLRLVQPVTKSPLWTVVVSGETWQDTVSKTDKVTDADLQPGSKYFDKLVVLKAFYDKHFMEHGNMDCNMDKLPDNIRNTFDVESNFSKEWEFREALYDLISVNLPSYFDGYDSAYPWDSLKVDIYDGEGNKYELSYNNNDVVRALKNLGLVK